MHLFSSNFTPISLKFSSSFFFFSLLSLFLSLLSLYTWSGTNTIHSFPHTLLLPHTHFQPPQKTYPREVRKSFKRKNNASLSLSLCLVASSLHNKFHVILLLLLQLAEKEITTQKKLSIKYNKTKEIQYNKRLSLAFCGLWSKPTTFYQWLLSRRIGLQAWNPRILQLNPIPIFYLSYFICFSGSCSS